MPRLLLTCVALMVFAADGLAKLAPTVGVSLDTIERVLTKTTGLSALQREFLGGYFLPVVGLRGMHPRPVLLGTSLVWEGTEPGEFTARVDFNQDVPGPVELQLDDGTLVLRLPTLDPFQHLTRDILQRWLIGHHLHPFDTDPRSKAERVSLGEPPYFLRDAQLENIELGEEYLERFATLPESERMLYQKLVNIGPTGSGKSLVLLRLLRKRLSQLKGQSKLTIVLADRTLLVKDRCDEVEDLQKHGGTGFNLLEWREDIAGAPVRVRDQGIRSVSALLDTLETSEKPTVLVATTQSLLTRMRVETAATRLRLRRALRGIFYDEVHHMPAFHVGEMIRFLIEDNAEAMLHGFTATPTRADMEFLSIFGGHAFWMYRNTKKGYLEEPGEIDREVSEIAHQLRAAFDRGELTSFDDVEVLALGESTKTNEPLWKRTREGNNTRKFVNPLYYEQIFSMTRDLFTNRKGIVPGHDQTEAVDFQNFLNRTLGKNVAEAFTHDLVRAGSLIEQDILSRFATGPTRALTCVKKTDEGLNIHGASFYLDLNENPGARTFLQRLGRTTRNVRKIRRGKVVLLSTMTETELRQGLDRHFSDCLFHDQKNKSFRIPMPDFLKKLATLKSERIRFWEDEPTYPGVPLNAPQLAQFRTDVLSRGLFAGHTARTITFFRLQVADLDEQTREIFYQEMADTGLKPTDLLDAVQHDASLNRLHWTLQALARARKQPTENLWELKKIETLLNRKALSPADIERFRTKILSRASVLFAKRTMDAPDFFQWKASELPEVRRAEYLWNVIKIRPRKQDFMSGLTQDAPAIRVFWLLGALAQGKGFSDDDIWDDEKLELIVGGAIADADEIQLFRENVLAHSRELFPGNTAHTDTFFQSFARDLPLEIATVYRQDLLRIGLRPKDLSNAPTKDHSARRVIAAFQALGKAKRVAFDCRQGLSTARWLLGLRTPLTSQDLDSFRTKVLAKPHDIFGDGHTDASTKFHKMSQKMSNEESRKGYEASLAAIGLRKNDILIGKRDAPAANRVFWALQVLASALGQSTESVWLPEVVTDLMSDENLCSEALHQKPLRRASGE